jgi:hypothetical protein
MTVQATPLTSLLETDSGIAEGYRHVPKHVVFGEPIERQGAALKWYEVHPLDRPVPDDVRRLARSLVETAPLEASGLGFVILHRCGQDFYFLILNTWRGSNEIWETVFYKDGDAMTAFQLFPRDGTHKPTFCVWELVPVWHEQQAWVRFLTSPRDADAAEAWLRDGYSGPA